MKPIKEFQVDNLKIKIFKDRESLGKYAAIEAAEVLRHLTDKKDTINCLFAAAPSQDEFLKSLSEISEIKWEKINAFHMDEFIGIGKDNNSGFGNYLSVRIFNKVSFKNVFYLDGKTNDPEEECKRYSDLLKANPLDIVFMGIGENGHIAFNDPHVADFNDSKMVKIVELDDIALQQQVNDGHFKSFSEVPKKAITVTIPVMTKAPYAFILVPGKLKAKIIKRVLEGEINTECPGSVMRKHPNAVLYLDTDSASLLSY